MASRTEERRRREREALRAQEREERRREEARERAREEAREAEREAEREEARREEARREAREREDAERRARARLAQIRARQSAERRQEVRRRQAERERIEERTDAARDEAREAALHESVRQARREERNEARRDSGRRDEQREERAEQRREERVGQQRSAETEAGRLEERDRERREEQTRQRLEEQAREQRTSKQTDERRRERQAEEHRAGRQREERQRRQREAAAEERRAAAAADRRERTAAERRREARPDRPKSGPRLPSGGVLSGSLPWLRVSGPRLVDERDQPVTLRGVTVRSLERARPEGSSFRPAVDDSDLTLLADWGATAITVPIAQDLALYGRDEAEGGDYLEALDATIGAAAAAGLYTLVQLSLISSVLPTHVGAQGDLFDPAVPDPGSLDLWPVLAHRYAAEPAVLFDLFRQPHDPGPGDSTGLLMPRLTWDLWHYWLFALLGEIRRVHPRSLVFAKGLVRDLSGFPLAYSDGSQPAHIVYGAELSMGEVREQLPGLARLARHHPAGIFSWKAGSQAGPAVEAAGRALARMGLHWMADEWRGGSAPLVVPGRGRLEPTALGRAFRSALAQPDAPETNLVPSLQRETL